MFGKKSEDPDLVFFTVYDSKSKSYAEPFPAPNREVILREFSNAFRKPDAAEKNRYYQNAEDYSIFKIGSFNRQSGELQGHNLEHIANMHDIRAMSQPDASPRALSST